MKINSLLCLLLLSYFFLSIFFARFCWETRDNFLLDEEIPFLKIDKVNYNL